MLPLWMAVVMAVLPAVTSASSSPRLPIAAVTARNADGKSVHEGEIVTIAGTAIIDSSAFYKNLTKFFIEDDQSGIAVFSQKVFPTHVALGDVVQVTGRIVTYQSSIEIIPDSLDVISHGRIPQPQMLSGTQLVQDRWYGRLVQTRGQVVDVMQRARGNDVRVQAGRELITLHFTDLQRPRMPQFEVGSTIVVTGICSTFVVSRRLTAQILPRYPADIEIVEPPPLFTREDATKAAVVASTLILLFITWSLTLRRRVRKEMEQHLESEARFQAVAQTAPVAIFIYQGTRFRYGNRAAEQITGYSRQELSAREFWDILDPCYRDLARDRGLARQRGENVPSRYEFPIIRKDGTRAWLDFSASLIQYGGETAVLGTAFDITERKNAVAELEQSEKRFRALVENSTDAIAMIDAAGKLLWVGPSTERVLGYTEEESIGSVSLEIIHREDRPRIEAGLAELVNNPGGRLIESYRARAKDKRWLWVEIIATNLLDEPAVGAIVVNYRDVSERKRVEEEMRHQALHDTLTGLPNRNLYQDRLGLALAKARRTGRPLAVMFVDLDLFKLINDNLGHVVGDGLLKQVGQRVVDSVRVSDTVARVGGDEFVVIVEDLESTENALEIADKMLERVAQPYSVDEHQLHVSASIGISVFPYDGDDSGTLTRNADKAMYRAKELGRSNVQLFTVEMNERYRSRLLFEAGFRRALEQRDFVLHYQLIYSPAQNRFSSAEALVRWNDSQRGLVYPDEFIPAAEESRMIVPLGAWVLRTACEQLHAWQSDAFPGMHVSVNLSVRQFHQRDLLAMIDNVIAETQIDPATLELEITESVAMQNVDLTRTLLQELRARDVRIAIDDFGAGQSSLLYLRQFPINTIKIDRVFVREITTKKHDAAIVGAVIRLAHDLGMTVTAEGVETEEQRDFLVARGCDFLQGYLYSRPKPADAVFAKT